MRKITRILRLAIAAQLALLAIIFDMLSNAAHWAVDRVSPKDEANAVR